MLRPLLTSLLLLSPIGATAQPLAERVGKIVDEHILPRFGGFAETTEALAKAAQADCKPTSEPLLAAYNASFDAWIAVSHLRFGPTETDDRAFALAFWPDTKGFTPKSLGKLMASEDPAVNDPAAFSQVSIASRGVFAMEFMLFDESFAERGATAYRCALIRAIAHDIDANADAIVADWQDQYAALLRQPREGGPYSTEEEAVQELYKALLTGLQFTSDTRLGRPLGTFEKPRPKRAEARRSGRSLRNVVQSLESLQELGALLAEGHPSLAASLDAAFAQAHERAAELNDPVFAGVSTPQGRLRVEILQQSIDQIREIAVNELGPTLGVAAGFNALDGD